MCVDDCKDLQERLPKLTYGNTELEANMLQHVSCNGVRFQEIYSDWLCYKLNFSIDKMTILPISFDSIHN